MLIKLIIWFLLQAILKVDKVTAIVHQLLPNGQVNDITVEPPLLGKWEVGA